MCVSTSPIIVLMALPGCAEGCAIGDEDFPQWPGAGTDVPYTRNLGTTTAARGGVPSGRGPGVKVPRCH